MLYINIYYKNYLYNKYIIFLNGDYCIYGGYYTSPVCIYYIRMCICVYFID